MTTDEPPNVTIPLGPTTFIPDRSGALWWPQEQTLIAADLHLEKGAAYARRGAFLPPYDTTATMTRLATVLARYAPRHVILLGDSFHDTVGMLDLNPIARQNLTNLQQNRDWSWITGNHDPVIAKNLGGTTHSELQINGISFRHEPSCSGQFEIAGHLHPGAKIKRHGRTIRRPCFIADEKTLIMPALGAYTGSLNVTDKAFDAVFPGHGRPDGPRIWMLGRDGVYQIARSGLKAD